ncbi:MAG TPA: hypothetical protein VN999_13010, partial [Thermoanaerobaculia bacterium]|nr:hypothetical protein [Thermoanaerobaculia bacterium]
EWRIDSAAEDGALHLAVSLVDGDPADLAIDMQRLRAERPQGPGFYAKYQFVGPTFHSYMRAFERDGLDDDKPLGRLWFEVQTAADSGVLGRTVHLALSLSEPVGAPPGRDGNG